MTWQAIKACLTHKVWARVIQASCPVCLDAQDGTVLLLPSHSSLVASFLCSALGDQAGGHLLEQLHKVHPVSAICRASVHIIKDHPSDPESGPCNTVPALLVSISVPSTRS